MKRSSFSILVILALGIIFLLNNLGYLSWDIWNTTFRFWPALLIFIALELMFTKKGSPQLLFVSAILIFVVPFFLQGQKLPFNLNLNFLPKNLTTGELKVAQKLGTLIAGKATFELGAGSLTIDTLDKQSTQLLDGDLKYTKISKEPTVNFNPSDGTGDLSIKTESNLPLDLETNDWRIALSQTVPFSIIVKAKNSRLNFNLSPLKIDNLKLDLGRGDTQIQFPVSGSSLIEINATDGTINLSVPEGRIARISLPEQAKVDIAGYFEKRVGLYVSGDFDRATEKIDIKIDPGNAKVTVK